jgi:hypothetical protein
VVGSEAYLLLGLRLRRHVDGLVDAYYGPEELRRQVDAEPAEAEAHLLHWPLVTPEQAARSVRFVIDPTWRAYVINYWAGRELCHAWVGGDPARFVRLVTEHVRVRDLLAAVSSTS